MVEPCSLSFGDLTLSGWLTRPAGPPRCAIVALHGHGMHAGYFDHPVDPSLSLLRLAPTLGFTVWAPDRPGYGASAHLPVEAQAMAPQAELLADAIDTFAATHDAGAGVMIVGHSFGLKLALAIAATERGGRLLGIEGSSSGYRYAFDLGAGRSANRPGDKSPSWGPEHMYPPAIFTRGICPVAPSKIPDGEAEQWPLDFEAFAARITVPVRFTFGEHERLWLHGGGERAELAAMLSSSPRVEFDLIAGAGHNVSLSYAARAYHLKALAFVEECVLAAQSTRSSMAS